MYRISIFSFLVLMNFSIYSQATTPAYFESVIYNIESITVNSHKNEFIIAGRQSTRKGDTLVLAKIVDNKQIEWKISYYYEGRDLYPQNIIQNDDIVIILLKTITLYNHLQNKREEGNGLILCYDKKGSLIWKKETAYIPISAAFIGQRNFVVSYLFNYMDGIIQRFNMLGVSLFDTLGSEFKNVTLKDAIPYSSGVFLRYIKELKEIEVVFTLLNDTYANVKKTNLNESLQITKECENQIDFSMISKIERDNQDVIIGQSFNKKTRTRNLLVQSFNCDNKTNNLSISESINLGESIWISGNYVLISKTEEIIVYKLDKSNDKLKMIYKFNTKDNFYNLSVDEKGKLVGWVLKPSNDEKEPFKTMLGVVEININKLLGTGLKPCAR